MKLYIMGLRPGRARVHPRREHRARHDDPAQSRVAVGSDRALHADLGRQPGDNVQADAHDPRAGHHDNERLLAAAPVRRVVHTAVPQVRRPAPAAPVARTGHGVVGLPRVGHHDDHVDQAGERARGMARTVRHRFAHVPADRQRYIHQSDHIAPVRKREYSFI